MKIEKTSLDNICNIFMDSTILKQSDHDGMRITELNNSESGNLIVIQGSGDGVLVIHD